MPRLLAVGVTGTFVAATLCAAPAPAAARPGADPAATAVQPGAMSLTSRDGGPAGQRTVALVRPMAARHAHAADRGFAPAAATYNPATGTQGFGVFVQGNAALGQTSTVGPVAMGGNLTVGSNFTVASQTAGTYTAPGDSAPTGLLVGGSINWSGSNSGGTVSVGSGSDVNVGNLTGSFIPSNGTNPTHIVPTGGTYNSKPQVALATFQSPSLVSQPNLINFTSAFSTFAGQSADMASCANSLVLTNSNGTALSLPLSPNTNANVTLTPGTQNVLNISAANLANISTLTFNNSPTSTMPLIINVNTSGVSNNFSWTPGNFNGVQNPGVPYMLWNFSTATQVTIGGSSTVPGTIYAPGATVNDNDQNGLNGGIIAAAYAQGGLGGSPNGGQVQNNPFAGTIRSCSTPQLTISLGAGTSTAVPGGTVHYTVSVTNSGSAAYSAATFTDSLSGVIDDATYNGDASASAGSVSYTSPNLTWTGSLAVGATATITFSATVNNPDTGDKSLVSTVTSSSTGSNCAAGSTDSRCSNTIPVSILTMAVTASPTTTAPGATVSYTITVTNSGTVAYTGAALTDSLSGVLHDASYNRDASATAGSVTYSSPNLTWTGNLAVGAVATITFSVTVNNPDTGDKLLASTVTSATAGSNCPAGSTDSRCTSSIQVLVPGLAISVSAGTPTTTPGAKLQYTVTVTNTGGTAYTGAAFTDPLGDVLDDASYNNDATVTAGPGSVTYSSPNLAWTGNLGVGAVATITFSVTVSNPDTGNKILASTITSATPGSTCPAGNPAASCTATVDVAVLTIVNSAGASSTTPGSVVRFTATFTNSGQVPYTGITVVSNITNVVDDATPNGDQTATSGTLSLTATGISWTGNIPVGGTVTITGTVTVNNPDTGNKDLASTITTAAAGSNCPAGGTDPRCSVSVPVLIPALTITATANTITAVPGIVIGYTVTVTDSGQTPYTGATFTDSLTGALDNASYDSDPATTAGSVTYSSPNLTWTGNLAVGATATITFSVTVNNPDTGDKVIVTAVTSSTVGSTCPASGQSPGCTVTVAGLTPALTIAQTASPGTATPGAVVHYTVTVTDSGQTAYTGAAFTDPLSGVLDDAAYDGDATATAGTVLFVSPTLTWTGNLAAGAAATITFSVTVNNPDTGDHILASTVTSATAGSNCAAGSGAAACTATADVAVLTIVASSNVSTTTPGSVVRFTAVFTNSGQVPYTGITIAADAADVFDDATSDGDQTATSGTLTVTATGVSWTGNIPVGGSVTITGTVTVDNPDTGNKVLTSIFSTAAAGSNCPARGTDPRCSTIVTVLVPALSITQAANATAAVPGQVIGYTLTITNTGTAPYAGTAVTDSFAGVLDDAAYDGDASPSSGTVAYASPVLTWTGDLAPSASAVVTFSVTVSNPDTGDKLVITTASSAAVGSSCPPGTTSGSCQLTVPVLTPGLTIVKTASTTTPTPGLKVIYTITVTDTGQTTYSGASLSDPLGGVLDDAAYNNDASATAGTVSYAGSAVSWTGNLNPSDTATITYSVTISNPETGDLILANTVTSPTPGSNCAAASTDPRCTVTLTVVNAATLTITATAGAPSAVAGGVVNYTITVANSGLSDYAGAALTVPLSGVLGGAAYDNDAAAVITGTGTPAGTVSYTSPDLAWTGTVPATGSVTLTYSVTVDNPDTGNQILSTTVSSAASADSNCGSGSTDPRCTTTVKVSQLLIDFTASASTTTPGGTLVYTATFTNTGQTPYLGISVSTGTVALAANVTSDGNITASSGTLFDRGDRNGLDREHPRGRHRHHHLPCHGGQPRDQRRADRHRRIHRTRKQLPGRQHRPPLHPRHPDPDPGPVHRDDREHHGRGARPDGHLHRHRHRQRPDPLRRRNRHRHAEPAFGRDLQRQRGRDQRHRQLRQPSHHLDRRPGGGRLRGHHLHRHREQPRHRRQEPRHRRRLDRSRQQLPAGQLQRGVQPRRSRADPGADHRQDRQHDHRHGRPDGHLHGRRHRLGADPVHRRGVLRLAVRSARRCQL